MTQTTPDALLLQNYAVLRLLCHDVANTLSIIQLTCRQLSQSAVLASDRAPWLVDRICRTADVQKHILANAKALGAYFTEPVDAEEVVDLRAIAAAVVEEFSDTARQKSVEIRLEAMGTCYVFGQRFPLESLVFRTLISNAVKYSFPGGVVRVSLAHEGESVILVVQDEGVGIPAARLPHIFEHGKFALTEGTAGERGMGLGMYLTKILCDRMGVKVGITSSQGEAEAGPRGTTVTLRFESA